MNSAWFTELNRIFLIIISIFAIGVSSGYWLFPIVAHFILYVVWILVQLRGFEEWIRNGARSKSAPDASGIWALIVQQISRTQTKNKEHKRKLAGLAKRYQAIMTALPDATLVLNHNFEIEWANQIAEELLGIDIKRDVGQRVDNIIRDQAISHLLTGRDSIKRVEIISPVDPQKTLVASKIQYGDNQTLFIARDISQRIALIKMRKAFIANASHELRTPLTVVSGYLEMLEGDDDLASAPKKLIKNAHQQASRMDRILDDLLTLSKLEEKGFSKDTGEIIDAPIILQRMIGDLQKTTAKDTHEFNVNIDKDLKIKVVEREFFSLCQNLLSNAIKYSEKGSKIEVCWQLSDNGLACLKVKDNGEGIAQEHLNQLTERFYRINVSRSRTVGGTELGLSIVKHIMENYGGHLEISSELGNGSEFTACFPVYRVI